MRLKDFSYNLPSELIAQKQKKPRDHSRLLVLDKKSGRIEHKHFFDLVGYLKKGDVLVLNNSKVFPARLFGKKSLTGGKTEVFLLKKEHLASSLFQSIIPSPPLPFRGYSRDRRGWGEGRGEVWQCLVRNGKVGAEIIFEKNLKAKIVKKNDDETYNVWFNKSGRIFMGLVEKIGHMPLPPYIKQGDRQAEKTYQTIYAQDKKLGSVAAPTAGLHFTPALLAKLKKAGVEIIFITLHVGLGTFAPVKIEDITKHKMHAEWVEIDKKTADRIKKAKKEKRRIIAVGTTSARALESVLPRKNSKDFSGWVDIFIYPPYKFKIIDAMITNFHLPQSTLLMLVGALAGRKKILRAYGEAIKRKYRFFSYGDAMFIA